MRLSADAAQSARALVALHVETRDSVEEGAQQREDVERPLQKAEEAAQVLALSQQRLQMLALIVFGDLGEIVFWFFEFIDNVLGISNFCFFALLGVFRKCFWIAFCVYYQNFQ